MTQSDIKVNLAAKTLLRLKYIGDCGEVVEEVYYIASIEPASLTGPLEGDTYWFLLQEKKAHYRLWGIVEMVHTEETAEAAIIHRASSQRLRDKITTICREPLKIPLHFEGVMNCPLDLEKSRLVRFTYPRLVSVVQICQPDIIDKSS